MAKYSNVFKEASKRYKDFKARGFIPAGSKYAYQDFVNEVIAENHGEYYEGAYTANAYEKTYGVSVDYYETEAYSNVLQEFKDKQFEKYREELLDIFDKNDFLNLAEKYGNVLGFFPSEIFNISNLSELLQLARKSMGADGFVFRNQHGRNRRTESNDIDTYQSSFRDELNVYIDDIQEVIFM